MKVNSHQQCQRCGGSKIIASKFSDQETSEISEYKGRPCPRCNGEGIEYLVSPKYVEMFDEYQEATRQGITADELRYLKEIEKAVDIEGTPV